MSMNNNLEVKVSELTDVIKGLSNKPFVEASDLNNVLNSFVKRVEDSNELNINKITDEMSEALINALNEKYKDIQERLSLFEEFAASIEKTVQNSKTDSEITRILNDIEALHSKMNSQELQTENLIKAFDSIKNSTSAGQVSRLADEIVSISKSYDGIVEVLNNNFQEFLRRVENSGNREDIQRLRYFMESVENNQNVLVSAMNAVNDKQDEIKNLVKQSSSAQTTERFDYIQNAINQLNKTIIDTTTKADLEIIADKINQTQGLISEFKRQYTDDNEDGIKTVFQGQLNNIISKLESIKLENNSNVNEDIIRLYNSIAEFKDNVYSAINTQLNDVIASMDVQFDKISNSVVNSTLDNNEAINNLTDEVQKAKNSMQEGLNERFSTVKEEIQKQNRENAITIVNSLKGELEILKDGLNSLSNNEDIQNLANAIDGLKSNLDIDTLLIQIDQIKSSLDFTPIKEQIELLNKDETINLINQKIDKLLEISNTERLLDKIDEVSSSINPDNLYSALNSINDKIDFSSLDEKLNFIRSYLTDGLDNKISNLNERLNLVENIGEELVSIKNLDYALSEIKASIEENLRLYNEKQNEDRKTQEDIKDALKTIYEKLQDEYKLDDIRNSLNSIKENINSNSSGEFDPQNYENAILNLSENISSIQEIKALIENLFQKYNESQNENGQHSNEIKEAINSLYNLVQDDNKLNEIKNLVNSIKEEINSNASSENNFEEIKNSFISLNENIENINKKIEDTRSENSTSIQRVINSINELQSDVQPTSSNTNNIDFVSELYEVANSIRDDINSQGSRLTGSVIELQAEVKDVQTNVKEDLNTFGGFVQNKIESLDESLINSINEITDKINLLNIPSNSLNETKILELKEQMENISDLIGKILENPVSEQLNNLEQSILSCNIDNSNITKELVQQAQSLILDNIQALKGSILSDNKQASFNEILIPLFDEFETRLNEKIVSLETLVEETGKTGNSSLQDTLLNEIRQTKVEIQNQTKLIADSANEVQKAILGELIKNQLNEMQLDSVNYLKQESELLTSFITENLDVQTKEIVSKFAQIINAKENSEARINLIKTTTSNISDILENSEQIKNDFLSFNSKIEEISNLSNVLNSSIEELTNKLGMEFGSINSNLDEKLNSFDSKIKEILNENNANLMEKLTSIIDFTNEINSKLANAENKSDLSIEFSINSINENIKAIEATLKEQIEKNSSNLEDKLISINNSFEFLKEKIENSSDSNTASFENIENAINSTSANLEVLKSDLKNVASENKKELLNTIQGLMEAVNSIEANIQNSASRENENPKEILDNLKSEINSLLTSLNNSNRADFTETKEKIGELKNEIEKTQEEIKASFADEMNNLKTGYDILIGNVNNIKTALDSTISAETYDIKEQNNKLIDDINSIKESLENSINKADLNLKDYFDDTKRSVNSIQAFIENLNETAKTNKEDIETSIQELKAENIEAKNDVENKIQQLLEQISNNENIETINEDDLQKLKEALIQEFENLSSSKNEVLYNELKTIFDEEKIEGIKNSIVYALNNSSDSRKNGIIEKIEENTNNINENIDNAKNQINSIKENIISSIENKEELIQNSISNLKNDVQNAKNEISNNAQGLIDQLKQEMEDIKASLTSKISANDNSELIETLMNSFEEKMQEKVSVLEGVIDNSLNNLDEKTIEAINRTNEDYKKALDNRVDFIIEKLQAEYEDKLTDIQKLIDNRIYEIINHNNEIIKDELKLRADSTLNDISKEFTNKFAKIESVLIKNEEETENGENKGYTLADVESDIAKIRLNLEKNNKLTNFKEFAARLVELKNINLENAKISRVIGSDIMRFDSWLKNATAKIDLLAAKIEKSEKIKMEDLKTRLIQSEKNQAMPQKLEEAIMAIYKKYRVQETKIEDMINKMEAFTQKQSDTFDIKEFIDLFYDNTKKQDNLISRMDGLEDKMDYMQAKIDHIISSCIDE
ncbi:TPA: hypothetical protein IAA92_01575 [Candidatus Galligastranaerophilus intestinigallinarum]|nr:hypothetical protein [Candidatus Galligastranaerophilus intestinigallinarum]